MNFNKLYKLDKGKNLKDLKEYIKLTFITYHTQTITSWHNCSLM